MKIGTEEKRQNEKLMKKEIRKFSWFCGLKIGYQVNLVLLTIGFVLQAYYHYPVTAAIIGVVYAIFPWIWESVLSKYVKESTYLLQQTKKRYGYSTVAYKSYQMANNILILLIILWQISNNNSTIQIFILSIFPSVILVCSIGSTLIASIYYSFIIPNRLTLNL